MPKGKKSYRKKGIKRTTKARRLYKEPSPSVYIGSALNPIPNRIFTSMEWCELIVFTVTPASKIGTFYVRANSIYDPRYNVGGASATAYDILAQQYYSYRVSAVDWSIVSMAAFLDDGTELGANIIVGCLPVTTTDVFPNILDIGELLTMPGVQWNTQDNNNSNKKVSGKTYLPKLLGTSLSEYRSDDLFGGAFGGNPSATALLGFFAHSDNATAENAVLVQALIKVKYYVEIGLPIYKNLIQHA